MLLTWSRPGRAYMQFFLFVCLSLPAISWLPTWSRYEDLTAAQFFKEPFYIYYYQLFYYFFLYCLPSKSCLLRLSTHRQGYWACSSYLIKTSSLRGCQLKAGAFHPIAPSLFSTDCSLAVTAPTIAKIGLPLHKLWSQAPPHGISNGHGRGSGDSRRTGPQTGRK